MSDARLREHERRAREGDREAMALLLVEWTRMGEAVCDTPHRPMTPEEVAMAAALGECSFPVASWDKRYGRGVAAQARGIVPWITFKQARELRRMVQRYRRQISAEVVALAKAQWTETLPSPLRVRPRREPGSCATCWVPFGRHTPTCAAHPDQAARREREALGMFAPAEDA